LQRSNKRSLVDSSVKIAALIRELNLEAITNGAVVIVEGKRDEHALRAAGYTGPLVKVKTLRMTLQKAASRISAQHKKAILLLDYDKQGEELAEIGLMVKAGIVAISDDGESTKDSKLLRNAMDYARSLGIPVFTHSEDKSLSEGGHMNEGPTSTFLGIPGMPKEAEEIGTIRDLVIAKLTGVHIHVCHVSTKGALQAIKAAREEGVRVTCEITPHHFTLTEEAVKEFDTNAKMCPPLREEEDVIACRKALKDNTAQVIATDHAPHSKDEKAVEFCQAPFGIIGLQTLLPLSLQLVRAGWLTLSQMVEKLSWNPAKVIGKPDIGTLKPGARANVAIFDPNEEFTLTEEEIRSKSKNTPFLNRKLKGRVKFTIYNGKIVYKS